MAIWESKSSMKNYACKKRRTVRLWVTGHRGLTVLSVCAGLVPTSLTPLPWSTVKPYALRGFTRFFVLKVFDSCDPWTLCLSSLAASPH